MSHFSVVATHPPRFGTIIQLRFRPRGTDRFDLQTDEASSSLTSAQQHIVGQMISRIQSACSQDGSKVGYDYTELPNYYLFTNTAFYQHQRRFSEILAVRGALKATPEVEDPDDTIADAKAALKAGVDTSLVTFDFVV